MTTISPAVSAPATAAASTDVFHQLGQITRQLHDALTHLGVIPKLRQAADGLPDVRSRLNFIVKKTGEAAETVLNSVDRAKLEHTRIAEAARQMAEAIVVDPVRAVATGSLMNFVGEVEAATQRIDGHLTDIMLAQDFHDLTGQVVAKVISLASQLEDSLVKLLVQAAPADQVAKAELGFLNGPVINTEGRDDVVANQGEVDDLLESLGF